MSMVSASRASWPATVAGSLDRKIERRLMIDSYAS
jgi:hypothetical protein